MFELFGIICSVVPAIACVVAAVYAYKAYELVKLERDIRIAREEAEKNKETEA